MELSEEFRARAQRCLKLAHDAPTIEAQAHWLAMAQLWLSLAQHAEAQDALFLRDPDPEETQNGDEDGRSSSDPQPES